MTGGGIIDRFVVAIGFAPDTSGLKAFERQAQQAKESILSIGNALMAFAAGFAVKEIASIGDQFEQNKIAIAGFLSALEISPDFKTGLEDAGQVIQQITRDAATLPGEAEDYIEVFRAGLPFVQAALPGGGLKEITAFTNQLTAVGKTFQLPADQIGRELGEILSPGKGRATLRNRLFMSFLPLLHKLEGQAHLTSEQFNAMTEAKRAELLQKALERMQPMLEEASKSFDAMFGAVKSGLKQLVLLGGKGLFEGMKKALSTVNDLFFDADGKITKFGQDIVDGGQKIGRVVMNVVTFGAAIISWLGKSEVVVKALKVGLVLLGATLTALAFDKVTGGVGRLLGGLLNLRRLLTGGLFLAIALVAEDLYVFSKGGDSVTGMLVKKLGPAGEYLSKTVLGGMALAFLALRFAAVRTAIVMAAQWAIAFFPVTLAIAGIALLAFAIYELWKHFDVVVKFIKEHWLALLPVLLTPLGPILAVTLGVVALAKHWDEVVAFMTPLISSLGTAFTEIGDVIGNVWSTVTDLVIGGAEYLAAGAIKAFHLLSDAWTSVTNAIMENPFVKFIIDKLSAGIDILKTGFNGFIDFLGGLKLPAWLEKLIDWVSEKAKGAAEGVAGLVEGAASGAAEFRKGAAASLESEVTQSSVDPNTPGIDRVGAFFGGAKEALSSRRIDSPLMSHGTADDGSDYYDIAPGAGMPRIAIPSSASRVGMDSARAGIGRPTTAAQNTYLSTTITVPAINVSGAQSPDATAKAVRREIEKMNRSTIRDAQSKARTAL